MADQDRDQTGADNQKTGQQKQHDDVQGGGGGSAGGGGNTKHSEGTPSENARNEPQGRRSQRTGSDSNDGGDSWAA